MYVTRPRQVRVADQQMPQHSGQPFGMGCDPFGEQRRNDDAHAEIARQLMRPDIGRIEIERERDDRHYIEAARSKGKQGQSEWQARQ